MFNKTKSSLAVTLSVAMLATMVTIPASAATTKQLSGADRYQTALKIVEDGWTSSKTAVIASGEVKNMPDALSAGPLAYAKGKAPILLTKTNEIPAGVLEELKALGVETVYIVGGVGAVSKTVADKLAAAGLTITRVSGADRFETSLAIAKEAFGTTSADVVIANGMGYADALSVSSIAAEKGMPILLVSNSALTAEQKSYIGNKTVYAVGGTGVLNATLVSEAKATRLGGLDRYETNAAILTQFKPDFTKIYLAKGTNENLVDALAGSVLAAKTKSPIVLVDGNNKIAASLATVVKANILATSTEVLLGGTVTQAAADAVEALKAPVATELKVESVSAINATQVKVMFTQAVDADDAVILAKYAINAVNPTAVDLADDAKSATLTFANATQVEVTNGVVVIDPIVSALDEDIKTAKFTAVLTFEDIVKPVIASVSSKTNTTMASSLTVKTSEPIFTSLAKVDGAYQTIVFSGDTGTITGLSLETNKAHVIELVNLTDKGGNVTVSSSLSFNVTVDTVAPTATLSAKSDKGILVTFSKSMDVATVVAALNANALKDELLGNVNYTAPSAAVADTSNKQFLIQVTDTLYTNKTSRSLAVVFLGTIKDSLGNAYVAGNQSVTLSKDIVKPVATGFKVIKDADAKVTDIEVNFSEGLAANATPAAPTIVDMNGVAIAAGSFLGGMTADAVTAGDKKVTYSVATPAKLIGKYAFSFGSSLVADRAETANSADAFSYTIDFGNGATTFSLPTGSLPTATSNVITVTFGRAVKGGAVANSATDIANYSLAGKPLPAGTTIVLQTGQQIATITLPTDSIDKSDVASVFSAANVMALSGEILSTYTGTVAIVDNVKPLLNTASLTTDNKLAIGFNEVLGTAPVVGDLVFKVNGSVVTSAHTGTGTTLTITPGTGSDAGKYLVNFDALVKQGSALIPAVMAVGADGILGTSDDTVTTPAVPATETYFDVNNNGAYDAASDIKIASGPVANFKFTSSPAITTVTITTLATGVSTAKDANNLNSLKNSITVSAK